MAVSLPALSAQPKHCGTITFHLYRRASLPVSKNTGFNVLFRQYAAVSPLRRCIAVMISTGILTCLPSVTAFALTLGSDSPWEDYLYPGNLGFSANMFFTYFIVTHVSIITSLQSSMPSGTPSARSERSPTQSQRDCQSFGTMLSPVTFSAQSH